VYQSPVAGNWQSTPLVVDGMMYITQHLNDVVALDAATGRAFWIYDLCTLSARRSLVADCLLLCELVDALM
jgi:glucose dehydrogenase